MSVDVIDSRGGPRPALLFAVAPTHVNFVLPAATAVGAATVTVRGVSGTATGTVQVRAVAPALFIYADLDQVNLCPLPVALRNRDEAEIALRVDGIAANPVTVAILSSPVAGQWGRRAALPETNSELSVAELDGKIYFLGGYPANRVSVRTVHVYDPATNAWRLTTPLPVALYHTTAVSVNGSFI